MDSRSLPDRAWAFVYAKQKNVPESMAGALGVGDVWTFVAIDAETKLVPSWAVGRRDGFTASAFIRDLADRLSTRVQLTSDGAEEIARLAEWPDGVSHSTAAMIRPP